MTKFKKHDFRAMVALAIALPIALGVTPLGTRRTGATQDAIPTPPADRTLIYVAKDRNELAAIPFEVATTPLATEQVAKSNKRSYIEMKGRMATNLVSTEDPRFYVFLPDEPNAKPPFLVRLTEKGGTRRVEVMAQKGYKGFAIATEDIVKPRYRVIGREGGMQFMEIRAREPLMPGEYAIIGSDLSRVATFRY